MLGAMHRVGSGISSAESAGKAAEEAVSQALGVGGLEAGRSALVFASAAWGPELPELLQEVRARLGSDAFVGASVAGLSLGGVGVGSGRGLAVLTLGSTQADCVHLDELEGEELLAADGLAARLSSPLSARDSVFLFVDSERLLTRPLLGALGGAFADCSVVGLGASSITGGSPAIWRGREIGRAGVAALVVRGQGPARVGIAASCRVFGKEHSVTRSQGHWILGLDGRPALDAFLEAAAGLELRDPEEAQRHLTLSITPPGSEAASCAPQSRLRAVVGIDARRGGISIPESVSRLSRVRFALRDGVAARENMERLCRAHTPEADGIQPAFGFFLAGQANQQPLFGGVGREARSLASAFPATPVVGLHGAFAFASAGPGRGVEIQPDCGVLALVDP
jgi:small ligand-binding sensory domain FIST